MKQILLLFTLELLLIACNQNDKHGNSPQQKSPELLTRQQNISNRISFNTITEIIADSSHSTWVEKTDSNFSLALHFEDKDTVWTSYSPECVLLFPYKQDSNRLIIYWDNNIDTKYNFDIVKAVNKIDRKIIGRPFMILELENDTTLRATYPMKDLIRDINNSSKERTFFPDKFTVVQEGKMYDQRII